MVARHWVITTIVLGSLTVGVCSRFETWPQIADRLNVHRHDIEAGRNVDTAFDALHEELASTNHFGRMYAVTIFRDLGPKASRSVPWLIKTLDDPDPVVRRESALTLSMFGPASEPAMEALIAAVRRSPTADTAWFAIEALGNIGPPARQYVPELKEHLNRYRTAHGESYPGVDSAEEAIQKLESP